MPKRSVEDLPCLKSLPQSKVSARLRLTCCVGVHLKRVNTV